MSIAKGNLAFQNGKFEEAIEEYKKVPPGSHLYKEAEFNIKLAERRLLSGLKKAEAKQVSILNPLLSVGDKPPFISVIVPIYNVESFIEEALESLRRQVFKDFEVILVNDGSTDRSTEIARRYAELDSRFVLREMAKNGGYGKACNEGLQLARGEYVTILEPDDYLECNAYEAVAAAAKEKGADIVGFGWYTLADGQRRESFYRKYLSDAGIPVNEVIDVKDVPRQLDTQPAVWAFVYRAELLKRYGIRFLETPGASFQDISFYFKVLAAASKVIYLDELFYNYRIHAAQSVRSKDKPVPILEYKELLSFLNSFDFSAIGREKEEAIRYFAINRVFTSLKFHLETRVVEESAARDYQDFQIILRDYIFSSEVNASVTARIAKSNKFVSAVIGAVSFEHYQASRDARGKQFLEYVVAAKTKGDSPEAGRVLVSIGVPVFNTARFLKRCLDSLARQTLREIEVIIFDDCSDDNSLKIAKEFAESDPRVTVVRSKKNFGVGAARNFCVEAAKGDYVLLVDSDDWIASDTCEAMYKRARQTGADIVACQVKKTYQNDPKKITNFIVFEKEGVVENPFDAYCSGTLVDPAVYHKLFSRRLFKANNICFPEYIFHQDIATMPALMYQAKKFATVKKGCYFYFQREGSAVAHISRRHIESVVALAVIIDRFLRMNNVHEKYKKFYIEEILWKWCIQRHFRRIVNFSKADLAVFYNLVKESLQRIGSVISLDDLLVGLDPVRLTRLEKAVF